jgi:hypothetical protein
VSGAKRDTKIERLLSAREFADGCADQGAGRSIEEFESRRDEFLVELLALAQTYWPEA